MNTSSQRHIQNEQIEPQDRLYPNIDRRSEPLDAQIEALTAAGCGMVRQEQRSGATLEGRPELKIILDFIHPGETLVVTRIDRLARSMQDLQTIVVRNCKD